MERLDLATEPEIHQHDAPAFGAHDIREFEVLMDDARGVDGSESPTQVDPDQRRLAAIENATLL
jgi:hypothetical protein